MDSVLDKSKFQYESVPMDIMFPFCF